MLTHDEGERIIAGLLRDHLGARVGDAVADAAEARRSRNPPPEPPPPAERPRAPAPARAAAPTHPPRTSAPRDERASSPEPRRPRGGRAPRAAVGQDLPDLPGVTISDSEARTEAKEGPAPSDGASSPDPGAADGDFLQVFINVGRREGLQARDLQKLLSDKGLGEVSSAGIRVRDRAAFVRVRKDLFDRAVATLSGEVIGGRTVVAELARER